MASRDKPKTVKYSIIASLALSIGLILAILVFTIEPETITYLSDETIRYEFFLGAMIINICFWTVWGARLKVLSNTIDPDVHISLWSATKIVIANLFLAGITPSMAGGEPVRVHLLNKDGMTLGGATASVLGERLLDAVFIICAVPVGFLIFKDNIENPWFNIALTVGMIVFGIAIVLFLWIIANPAKIKSFLVWLDIKLSRFSKGQKEGGKSRVVQRINREVDNFHTSMVVFAKEGKKGLLLAGILTILMWLTSFMMPSFILMGLGLPPHFIESYAAQILLILLVMLPTTPGSAAVTEFGVYGLYSILIGAEIIWVFVLLFRFITYHMNLIAGAIFQYRIFKSVASFSMDMVKKKESS